MPRRSGGGGGARRAPAPRSRVPATIPAAHPPAHPPAAQPRQPGLFGQMAATAGGVAIGHAAGHALVGAFSGSKEGEDQQGSAVAEQGQTQQQSNPCAVQMEEFMQCAKSSSGDLNLCYGFNEALKDCRASYGM